MSHAYTESDLEHYLDEALPIEEMSAIEESLRNDEELLKRLAAINARRDAGVHSVGAIWRRHRLTCPNRQELGNFLLGILDPAESNYIEFHLKTIGCRSCEANLEDLQQNHQETSEVKQQRQRKYFQSSAGFLPK